MPKDLLSAIRALACWILERLVTLHSTTWLLLLTFVGFKGFGMPKVQATCPLSSLDGFQESLWGATMTWWLAIKDYIHQDHVMLSSLWALFVYHGSCIHTWAHGACYSFMGGFPQEPSAPWPHAILVYQPAEAFMGMCRTISWWIMLWHVDVCSFMLIHA